MTNAETLTQLLTEEVIPDIEDYMDDLFVLIADKKSTDEDREELENMRELREEFKTMLIEIENGDMEEDECLEIIEEIRQMQEGDEEE
jgi:hypothetical protein